MFSDYEIQLSIGGFEDKWVSFRSMRVYRQLVFRVAVNQVRS